MAVKAGLHDLNPAKRAMLLTALYIAQEQHGWLSPQAIERVANRFDLAPGQVYATASFYTLFKLARRAATASRSAKACRAVSSAVRSRSSSRSANG